MHGTEETRTEAIPLPIFAPPAAKVAMVCFLVTEAAFFSTLIVTYIVFMEKSRPVAVRVFQMPLTLVSSACLLSSSLTIHLALGALARGNASSFRRWLALTILLGVLFLGGTALEWHDLIVGHNLSLASDLFGTTYFTLVGFHALHVSIGVILMLLALTAAGAVVTEHYAQGVELISWYWHFVDAVWVVVFLVVYVVGR